MKKILLNILFLFFSVLCFSQSIDLVRFDNSQTYNPGSGVSLHINPTGVFVLDNPSNLSAAANNAFHLELSASGGDFTNPTLLGTVYDFYTPLMNGEIPTQSELDAFVKELSDNMTLTDEIIEISNSRPFRLI